MGQPGNEGKTIVAAPKKLVDRRLPGRRGGEPRDREQADRHGDPLRLCRATGVERAHGPFRCPCPRAGRRGGDHHFGRIAPGEHRGGDHHAGRSSPRAQRPDAVQDAPRHDPLLGQKLKVAEAMDERKGGCALPTRALPRTTRKARDDSGPNNEAHLASAWGMGE